MARHGLKRRNYYGKQKDTRGCKLYKSFRTTGFGMFVHFGLYSQLNKGEWCYNIHAMEMDEYKHLIDTFEVKSMA